MAALAKDRNTASRIGDFLAYPVAASTKLYKGGMVSLNASGYAIPAADTASTIVIGVADEYVDNSAGANGAKWVRVVSGRAFKFAASSITQAMVGTTMCVVDDQTFDDAAGPTNDIACGRLVEYISATEGWVYIPKGGCGIAT